MIRIRPLAENYSKRFPNSKLTKILLLEPDEADAKEFVAKARTWLSIIDMEEGGEK